MLRVRKIDSFDLPELQPYRTMRRQEEHKQQAIFVAEGEKVVRRLIESRLELISVLLPQKWLEDLAPAIEKRREEVQVFVADKSLLETLTGFSMYQGLLAVGRVPAPFMLEQAIAKSPAPRLFVAVDALTSAENLGALIRNCAAFNVGALVLGETSTSPFLRRAVRSSMGAVFEMPIVESANLVETIGKLRSRGFSAVAGHPHASTNVLWQTALRDDCCLVFGSEGYGISPQVLAACDRAVAVPMAPAVDSLNVASASAVFLYEAIRQRAKVKP